MYKFNIILVSAFALWITSCTNTNNTEHSTDASLIISELSDHRRFISTEDVADAIINKDPSLRLIDVRSEAEHHKFSLPGALNIPVSDLGNVQISSELECAKYKIVVFSNAHLLSDQAWLAIRNQGCQDIYVLKDGINGWFKNILINEKPADTESAEIVELYNLRNAMKNHFLGLSGELAEEAMIVPKAKKAIVVKPKKKVVEEEEGC